MAVRKFLYFEAVDGQANEQSPTDELNLGKITLSGVGGVAIDAGNQTIVQVADPVAGTDGANKQYVDSRVNGLDWKESVRAVALSNITLSGTQTIDGVALISGDRVLVAGQTTGQDNGIYVVAAGAWTRATDADVSAEVTAGLAVFVEEGTVYEDTGWVLTTNNPITLGTTALVFSQFTGFGTLVAGAGILKTGNQIDVELDTTAAAQTAGSGGGSSGLEFDTAGVGGLLRAAVNGTAGLQRTASGLGILLDNTPNTLSSSAAGLKVTGVPLSFLINGVATNATVTAANLNTLTAGAGTDAAALHHHRNHIQLWTANGAINKGEGVRISANDAVSTAANTSVANSRVMGVANEAIANTATGQIMVAGVVTAVLSGATAGVPYYLGSAGAPVLYSTLGGNDEVVQMGFAKNATDLEVRVLRIGKKAA